MTKPRQLNPFITSLLAVALTLNGCQKDIVPLLSEADLRAAYFMTALDELPPEDVVRKITARDSRFCIDLHYGGTTFGDSRQFLNDWDKAKLYWGVGRNRSIWEAPGLSDGKALDPALTRKLMRAEDRAILQVARIPESALSSGSGKAWPDHCETRSWLGVPVYSGKFAFIDKGFSCGGLCGQGSVLALEYRDGRWRLVGKRSSWMS